MTHTFRCRLALAVLMGSLLALPVLGREAPLRPQDEAQPALTVELVQPRHVRLPLRLSANGDLAAWQEALVGTETSGLRLEELYADVGDTVERGQLLARFASDLLRAEVAQARAGLQEAQASAAEARSNAQRARKLAQSRALSESQVDQYLTAERTTLARVESARALYELRQVRLAQTEIRAPDSGVISSRSATVGAVMGAGSELFRLVRQNRLEWRAEVTAQELSLLEQGMPARISTPDGGVLSGRIRVIGPTLDARTRTALVYVDVDTSRQDGKRVSQAARAGMYLRGEFELGIKDALTIPHTALAWRDGYSYVYTVDSSLRARPVRVQVDRIDGDQIEVTAGIDAAMRIVASGAAFLNEGDLVRLAPDDSAAPKPADRNDEPT